MDEKKFEDLVYHALTKFYQNVIFPKMATKDDIKYMVVKDDLKKLATKKDLAKIGKRVENLESRVISTEKAVWKIADHQAEKLEDHEGRISELENGLSI